MGVGLERAGVGTIRRRLETSGRDELKSPRSALVAIRNGSVPTMLKPLVVTEIVVAYVRLRRRVRRSDIRDLLASIRARPASRPAGLETGSPEERDVATCLANAVRRTLRILPADSRCLMQSLVLSWLLSSRAISTTLVIGVQPGPDFAAHAWLEHAGRPVSSAGAFSGSRMIEI